jgi:hypothetical protein
VKFMKVFKGVVRYKSLVTSDIDALFFLLSDFSCAHRKRFVHRIHFSTLLSLENIHGTKDIERHHHCRCHCLS